MAMKKLREKKTVNEILRDARVQWFCIDATEYSNWFEYLTFTKIHRGEILTVGYDTGLGKFGGTYGLVIFETNTPSLQNKERMKALFELFYLPSEESI